MSHGRRLIRVFQNDFTESFKRSTTFKNLQIVAVSEYSSLESLSNNLNENKDRTALQKCSDTENSMH